MLHGVAKNNLKNFFNKLYGIGKSGRRIGAIWSLLSPGRSRACFTKDSSILKQTLHYFKEVPCFTVLQCAKLLQLRPTLCSPMDCSPPSTSVHGDPPGQNTGVGCHVLLQGVFPTQGSNPDILVSFIGRWGSLPLAPSGKPSISHTKTQKYSCIKIRRVLFAKIQRLHITCNTNLHVISI